MRTSFLAAIVFCTLPMMASAMPHDHQPPRPHAEKHLHGVELSREQRQKIAHTKQQTRKEHAAIEKRYLAKLPASERSAMQNELKALKDQERQTLTQLLSPEQQKAFAEREQRYQAQAAEWNEFKKWQAERKQQ